MEESEPIATWNENPNNKRRREEEDHINTETEQNRWLSLMTICGTTLMTNLPMSSLWENATWIDWRRYMAMYELLFYSIVVCVDSVFSSPTRSQEWVTSSSMLFSIVCYFLIVHSIMISSYHLTNELSSFDLSSTATKKASRKELRTKSTYNEGSTLDSSARFLFLSRLVTFMVSWRRFLSSWWLSNNHRCWQRISNQVCLQRSRHFLNYWNNLT